MVRALQRPVSSDGGLHVLFSRPDLDRHTSAPPSAASSTTGACRWTPISEQNLRREVVGRKNWLFLGSDEGARVNTIFVSLLASCQLHGIEPWAYLRDLTHFFQLRRPRAGSGCQYKLALTRRDIEVEKSEVSPRR